MSEKGISPSFPGEPAPAIVRVELARVVASAAFRSSPNLVSFLTYVTEATLTGRGRSLKAYTVATLGLGRGVDFDPRHDPIVRTEARRLRRLLARYYAEEGRENPVRIELPLGGYRPRFRILPAAQAAGCGPPPRATHSVPASAYLTYLATFFLDKRALGWPRLQVPDGFGERVRGYEVAA